MIVVLSFRELIQGERNKSGVISVSCDGKPDSEGIAASYECQIPEFEAGCYYAPFQRHDPMPERLGQWPDGYNRMQALKIDRIEGLAYGGCFLLLKMQEDDYLALLPIAGQQLVSWFSAMGDRLLLHIGHLGFAQVSGDYLLCAWARSEGAYNACRTVWMEAARIPALKGAFRLREEKSYPDLFRYLGWCSWEEFRFDISEERLAECADKIEKSEIPIRYMLIDDGHLDAEQQRLVSFEPDSAKFPNGWEPILSFKKEDKIKWFGIWLNFNGYWKGISPDNRLGELNDHLSPVPSGSLQPAGGLLSSFAFYDAMIGSAASAGFDFVKVDVQARNLSLYKGTEQPVSRAVENAQALEAVCARYMSGLINCMAHGPTCVFNTRLSAISRCSEDYLLGDTARARRHVYNSYANILYLGYTVWGDHDMFHSNDPASGRMMAVSKAVSGGPVYLSDHPDRFVPEHIWPLCFDDGELLRPLAPASPLEDSLFLDPYEEAKPFRVIAPLSDRSAIIVNYNLTEPERPVSGNVRREDYAQAGCMLPENGSWDIPREGLVLYDWETGNACRLEDSFGFEMPNFGSRLFIVSPVRQGWAVIGRPDKFLSPAAVEVLKSGRTELVLRVKEAGPILIWNVDGKPESEEARIDGNRELVLLRLKEMNAGQIVTVRRKLER